MRVARHLAWTLVAILSALAASKGAAAAPCRRQTIGPVVFDVPSVTIRPQFRLNGQPFPAAAAALMTLWASEPSALYDGPQLSLGRTSDPPEPVRVVPGLYDVYYSWESGSSIPRNQLTRVMRRVPLTRDRDLVIDVAMVQVSGAKLLNGEPHVDDGSAAVLRLRHADRGFVPLGGMLPSAFSVRVIAGTYDVEYDWTSGEGLPRNRHAVLRRVRVTTHSMDLDVDVPSVVQELDFRLNGGPFPSTVYDHGYLFLTRGPREEVEIGSSHASSVTVRLIPGRYDARWRHAAGSTVPRNEDALFARGVPIDGTPRILDVPSVQVSGEFRLNGTTPPQTAYETARISLAAADGRDRSYLGMTHHGGFSVRVVPGRYDLIYEHEAGGSVLPVNPRAPLRRGVWIADVSYRIVDIPVGRVEGDYLLNGEPFPGSAYETGLVQAFPLAEGATAAILGYSHGGGFSRPLLPGLYQAAFALTAGGTSVPRNTPTTTGRPFRVVAGDGNTPRQTIDVRAATLVPSYEHNGVPLPANAEPNARVHLHRKQNYLRLRDTAEGPREQMAMEGRFDVFYQWMAGSDLPRNVFMPYACVDLVR